jgi:hypothetical protein
MAFDSIACGADEPYVLTIDGVELLAYDASTGNPRDGAWRGSLISVADAAASEISRCALRGAIADLAAHTHGWRAACPGGVFAIGLSQDARDARSPKRLDTRAV